MTQPTPGLPFADPFDANNDPEFEADLTDVKSNFNVESDKWEAYISDVIRTSSKANNPMFEWTWTLTGRRMKDNLASVSADDAGKTFKNFTALTPNALWKVAETTEAVGLGATGSVAKFKKSDAVGLMAILDIGDQEYEGKTRSSINTVLPHPGGVKRVQAAGVPPTGAPPAPAGLPA